MKAIVMAGGAGTRLRPYTRSTPKPLMTLGGVPIIEIILGQLRAAGCDEATLCLFFRWQDIRRQLGTGEGLGLHLRYAIGRRALGTAGPLGTVKRPDEPVLVLNADLLSTIDFADVHRHHVESGAAATLVAARHRVHVDFGVLGVSDDHRLQDWVEKPDADVLVNAGVYVLDPCVWDRIPSGEPLDMPTVLQGLVADGERVSSYVLPRDAHWIDIGRLEDYYEADQEFRAHRERYLPAADDPRFARDGDGDGDGADPPAGLAAAHRAAEAAANEDSNEAPIALYDVDAGDEEVIAAETVLRSGFVSMGAETEAFEAEASDLLGAPGAVAVSSGTAALHLAAVALGLGPGDEVIVPSLTFVASAASIALTGARPVFCDVRGPDDLTLDPDDVAERITSRTRAIVVVHYGGWAADLGRIVALAREHGLMIIEDAAHAPMVDHPLGALGTVGDAGCFSFYATKNMTMGEGGLVVARDPEVLARVRRLRVHAMRRDRGGPTGYDVDELGFNYRPTEIGAAIGRVQLWKLGPERERRAELTALYHEGLAGVGGVELPFAERAAEGAHHLLPVLLRDGETRDGVQAALRERGIGTSVHYPALHLLDHYRRTYRHEPGDLPAAESAAERVLSLPLHGRLDDGDVARVCTSLAAALEAAPVLTGGAR